jgi:hypothetical protein
MIFQSMNCRIKQAPLFTLYRTIYAQIKAIVNPVTLCCMCLSTVHMLSKRLITYIMQVHRWQAAQIYGTIKYIAHTLYIYTHDL